MTDTKKIEDGGPAFPQLDVTACERDGHGDLIDPFTSAAGGMSLRDWFAGQALAGMLAMPEHENGNFHNNCGEAFIGPARYAYRMADAMLAARKAGGE